MIARLWSARAGSAQATAYAEHLKAHVLPATQAVEGYAGALLLEREGAGEIELMVITMWDSLDAIRGFAGVDIEGAVVADEAAALLTSFDERVRHYEIAARNRL